MGLGANLVRFVLKLANLVLLLLGIAMGLYALSTYSAFKKLKHENDHNVTMLTMASAVAEHTLSEGVPLPHLGLGDGPNNHLNFLNNTKVPIYITGLGGAGVFTTIAAVTGFYAADNGSPFCLNLYSFELMLMLIFQLTVVGLIYTHKVYIPTDQKKSAEGNKFAKFLLKQEKIAKLMALVILCLQVVCIVCACTLKSMKWRPKDEFEFDEDFQTSRERMENKQPLLHFADDSGSSRSKKKKKKGKGGRIRDKYADI